MRLMSPYPAVLVIVMLATAGALAACKHDDAKKASAADAGASPNANGNANSATDAGAPSMNAAAADAGAMHADAGTMHADATSPPTTASHSAVSSVYDRYLVKPKGDDDADAVKALVEKKLGVKVAVARKSVGKWVMVQLAPSAGGRTVDDQSAVVAALKQIDTFETVEADRMMKVK